MMEPITQQQDGTIDTINNGQTASIAIRYQVTGLGTITNTATKTTETQNDPNTTNDQSTATLNKPSSDTADISIDKKFWDNTWNTYITTANIGDWIYSIIRVTNNGPNTATGVTISNPTPTGLTYLNHYYTVNNQGNWIANDGSFNPTTGWNISTINNGQTASIAIRYQVTGLGTITNTATKTTETQNDPNTTNDQSTATLNKPSSDTADISIDKKFWDNTWNTYITTANIGDWIYSIIRVTNNGPDTATGVTISNPTPTGLTYLNHYYTVNNQGNWIADDGSFNPTTGWTHKHNQQRTNSLNSNKIPSHRTRHNNQHSNKNNRNTKQIPTPQTTNQQQHSTNNQQQ